MTSIHKVNATVTKEVNLSRCSCSAVGPSFGITSDNRLVALPNGGGEVEKTDVVINDITEENISSVLREGHLSDYVCNACCTRLSEKHMIIGKELIDIESV